MPEQRPWWALFIMNIGIPSTIALFFTWWITNSMENRVAKLEERQRGIENAVISTLEMMKNAGNSMHNFVERQQQQDQRRDIILSAICRANVKGVDATICNMGLYSVSPK